MNLQDQIKQAEQDAKLEIESLMIANRDALKAVAKLEKLLLTNTKQYTPVIGVTDK